MDWANTEEQQEVRNLARKILEDMTSHGRLVTVEASDERIDRELYAALGRANLLGVAIEEAHGGMDMGFFGLGVLLVEIGRTVAPVPVLPTLAMGAMPIARFGTDAQKARFLPGVAAGEIILTAALIEAGSEDPTQPQTTATPDGDSWRLDGVKSCVPAAHVADRVLVPARISPDRIGLFLLDPNASGVEQLAQVPGGEPGTVARDWEAGGASSSNEVRGSRRRCALVTAACGEGERFETSLKIEPRVRTSEASLGEIGKLDAYHQSGVGEG